MTLVTSFFNPKDSSPLCIISSAIVKTGLLPSFNHMQIYNHSISYGNNFTLPLFLRTNYLLNLFCFFLVVILVVFFCFPFHLFFFTSKKNKCKHRRPHSSSHVVQIRYAATPFWLFWLTLRALPLMIRTPFFLFFFLIFNSKKHKQYPPSPPALSF